MNLHFRLYGSIVSKNSSSNSLGKVRSYRWGTVDRRNGRCRWCIHCTRYPSSLVHFGTIASASMDFSTNSHIACPCLSPPFAWVKFGCSKLRWACPFLRRSMAQSPSNRDNDLTCAFAHQQCYPLVSYLVPLPVTRSITCFVGDIFPHWTADLLLAWGNRLSHVPFLDGRTTM